MRVKIITLERDDPAVARPVLVSTTVREVMKLQEHRVKYLICVLALGLAPTFSQNLGSENLPYGGYAMGQGRNIFDFFLRRFRSCDSCDDLLTEYILAVGFYDRSVCGRSNRFGDTRFLAGDYTTAHEFPWLANIRVKSTSIVPGVLINDRYVLTAASQLLNATASDIKVSLGEYDRCAQDISSINLSVGTIILYPQFNLGSHAHDLALIRFSRPIKFEDRIAPICLPHLLTLHVDRLVTLVGWPMESMNANGNRTCRPRKLSLPSLSSNECLKSGIDTINFHNDSGCAGVLGTPSFACESDAGSAVQYRSYLGAYDLIGIISDANRCNNNTGSAVFTKVTSHLNWLSDETRDACYCSRY